MAKHPSPAPPSAKPPSSGGGAAGGARTHSKSPIGVDKTFRTAPGQEWFDPNMATYSAGPKGRQRYDAKSGLSNGIQYWKGDDYAQLGTMTGPQILAVQKDMVQAGMLKPGSFQPGVADDVTRAGMNALMGQGNSRGLSWQDTLGDNLATAQATGYDPNATGAVGPATIHLTADADINSTVNAHSQGASSAAGSAQGLLGADLSDQELAQFRDQFHAKETTEQTDLHAASGNPLGTALPPGGTVAGTGAVANEFEQYAKDAHPEQYAATQMGHAANSILDTIIQNHAGGGGTV